MTSSLVGSEMCIRDRRKSWPCTWCLYHTRPGVAWCGAVWSGVVRGAVSYTHLTLPTICSV
eukprot:5720747-Prorocentrum_lima.AAC.1